jgi:hypothetical protein
MADPWASDTFRDDVGQACDSILEGDVHDGAMRLWELGMSNTDLGFAGGLWQIWGRITDEFTHGGGDPNEGRALAREAAPELRQALGDPEHEREFCDRWVYERLDIIL